MAPREIQETNWFPTTQLSKQKQAPFKMFEAVFFFTFLLNHDMST